VLAIDLLGVLDGRCPKGPFNIAYTTVLDPEHRLCWRHENELEVERDAQEEHQKWLDQDLVDQIQFSAQVEAEKEKKKVARLSGILTPKPKAAVSPVLAQGEFAKAESSSAGQSRQEGLDNAQDASTPTVPPPSEGRHITQPLARINEDPTPDTSGKPSPDMSL